MASSSAQETILQARTPSIEVKTGEADAQLASPLFRLPAELRQQIYELVIGSGQVHVILRSCTSSENPLFRISTTSEDITMHDYQKLTYSTCRNPSSFQTRYTLSKTSSSSIPVMYYNSRGHLPHLPPSRTENIIIPNWGMQHGKCYSGPQRDMVLQKYASTPCSVYNGYVRHDTRICVCCMKHCRILELEFGPPTAKLGLKKLHADSAVSVDGLLLSCRKVYGEARGLPFKLYTFDIGTGVDLNSVMETWLEAWQVAVIERLHVSCDVGKLGEVGNLVEKWMPGLKHLEMDVGGEMIDLVWVRGVALKLETVKILAGFDWDCRVGRQERRVLAERLERAMRGGREG